MQNDAKSKKIRPVSERRVAMQLEVTAGRSGNARRSISMIDSMECANALGNRVFRLSPLSCMWARDLAGRRESTVFVN